MSENKNLRYTIVTGGASGLGRAFCWHLAQQGWYVVVADIDQQGAEETLAVLRDRGGQGQVELLDVTDSRAWQRLAEKLRSQWPRLDLLVNNAGVCGAGKFGVYPLESFRHILEVNLLGVVNGCHACLPWFLETAPGGHVINIASIAVALNSPMMAAYNTSKAGVVAFSETLYGELREAGIGVTVVIPGFFRSRLLEQGKFDEAWLRQIAEEYTSSASFTAADVVIQTMQAAERRRLHVVLGWKARMVWRLKRLSPALFQKVIVKIFERDRRKISGNG
ncbi:MAG: SDR family NAD(P)-dependent oxidoreductase [Bythopirellula sp.]|nr:SDR family NAD(P)-dependent oxidoreductase [Bythopirellula sp.]